MEFFQHDWLCIQWHPIMSNLINQDLINNRRITSDQTFLLIQWFLPTSAKGDVGDLVDLLELGHTPETSKVNKVTDVRTSQIKSSDESNISCWKFKVNNSCVWSKSWFFFKYQPCLYLSVFFPMWFHSHEMQVLKINLEFKKSHFIRA